MQTILLVDSWIMRHSVLADRFEIKFEIIEINSRERYIRITEEEFLFLTIKGVLPDNCYKIIYFEYFYNDIKLHHSFKKDDIIKCVEFNPSTLAKVVREFAEELYQLR